MEVGDKVCWMGAELLPRRLRSVEFEASQTGCEGSLKVGE